MDNMTIYVIGDFEYVYEVAQAVSRFGGDGMGRYATLATIGALISIFIIGFRMVMTGGREAKFGELFLSWLAFVFLFGTTVRVNIESMVPPNEGNPGASPAVVRSVDNMPLGVAVSGALLSALGYRMTDLMETAFGGVSGYRVTDGGFGRSLDLLTMPLALADARFTEPKLDTLRTNLETYLSDCYMDKVNFANGLHPNSLLTSPNTCETLQYNSQWSTTEIITASGERQGMTCAAAFQHLNCEGMNDAMNSALSRYGQPEDEGGSVTTCANGTCPLDSIQDALDALGADPAKVDAHSLGRTALIAGAVQRSLSQSVMTDNRDMARLMIAQATAQRTSQWAGEESMFRRIMRPMMAFFEAMIYALAPFMAFMTGLGLYGIRMIIKYLQLTLWVQLFLPILAIANLYMETQARQAFEAIGSIDSPSSVNETLDLYLRALDWIGMAGMFASITPALTMALIFGGPVAMTYLAGRLQGGDHVNEKQLAPDLVSPGAVTTQQAQMTYNTGQGTQRVGYDGGDIKYDFASAKQADLSSGAQTVLQSGVAFAQRFAQSTSDSTDVGRGAQAAFQTNLSESINRNWGEISKLMERAGISDDKTQTAGVSREEAFAAMASGDAHLSAAGLFSAILTRGRSLGGDAAGGALGPLASTAGETVLGGQRSSRPGPGDDRVKSNTRGGTEAKGDTGLRGSLSRTDSHRDTQAITAATSRAVASDASYARDLSAMVGRVISAASSESYSESAQFREAVANNSELSRAYSDNLAASESFATTERVAASAQMSQSVSEAYASQQIVASFGARAADGVDGLVADVRGQFGDIAYARALREVQRGTIEDPLQQQAAAALRVAMGQGAGGKRVLGGGELSDGQRLVRDELITRAVSSEVSSAIDVDAGRNATLGASFGGVQSGRAANAAESVGGSSTTASSVQAQADALTQRVQTTNAVRGGAVGATVAAGIDAPGRETVGGHHAQQASDVIDLGEARIATRTGRMEGQAEWSQNAVDFWRETNMPARLTAAGGTIGSVEWKTGNVLDDEAAQGGLLEARAQGTALFPDDKRLAAGYAAVAVEKASVQDNVWRHLPDEEAQRVRAAGDALTPAEREAIGHLFEHDYKANPGTFNLQHLHGAKTL